MSRPVAILTKPGVAWPPPVTPPPTQTIFGYNTNEMDGGQQTISGRLAAFSGRAPVVRRYSGDMIPAAFHLSEAICPEKRTSFSFKADGSGAFTIAGLAAGNGNARLKSWVESIPTGWTVYLTYNHEINDEIRGGVLTPSQFTSTYKHLFDTIGSANLAVGTVVKLCANFMSYLLTDPAYFDDSWVPGHDAMDLLTFDIYGNPGHFTSASGSNRYGTATGTGYGTTYPLPDVRSKDMFDVIDRLGWGDKWGILEVNSPARDWDATESARAQWHKDMLDLFLARPTPPEICLLWEAPSGVNWDQEYGRVSGTPDAVLDAVRPYVVGSE